LGSTGYVVPPKPLKYHPAKTWFGSFLQSVAVFISASRLDAFSRQQATHVASAVRSALAARRCSRRPSLLQADCDAHPRLSSQIVTAARDSL